MRRCSAVAAALAVLLPAGAARAQDPAGVPDLRPAAVCRGHGGAITAARWSPDGARLATACQDGVVRIFDAATGALQHALAGDVGVAWTVDWTRDGTRVVSGGRDGTARIWDAHDGALLRVCDQGRPGAVLQVRVVNDDLVLVHGGHATPQVWSLTEGRKVGDLDGHTDVVWALALAGGRWVATGSQDRTARLWDLHAGGPAVAFGAAKDHPATAPNLGPGSPVLAVAVAPDGAWVASGHRDGSLEIWAASGELRRRVAIGDRPVEPVAATAAPRRHGPLLALAALPDGSGVVAGFGGGAVRLIRLTGDGPEDGRPLGPPAADWVQQLAVSRDSRRIAAGSWDGTARVWRADGACLGIARGPAGRLAAADLSPDGTRLLTAAGDGAARVWALP